jgi:hypothetical protein
MKLSTTASALWGSGMITACGSLRGMDTILPPAFLGLSQRWRACLAAGVRRDKIPFKGPNVAGYDYFEIFEFSDGKAVEESLNSTADVVLANVALAKGVRSDRCMIDTVLRKKLATKSASPLFHAAPNSSARSRDILWDAERALRLFEANLRRFEEHRDFLKR